MEAQVGLAGLGVMGRNLALNIAEKGFPISVYNRTASKVDETLSRASSEGHLPVSGHYSPADFVLSIQRPRSIIILVKAGAPVDQTINTLSQFMEPGDSIIDGGNEWYENTERRIREASARGLLYLGMGVSGGEDGARHGPCLMPGGSFQAFKNIEEIVTRVAAQVDDGPCVTYVGEGGSGNFAKMVHDGMKCADMKLISEAYDVLKIIGGLSNVELGEIFSAWNLGELESFLIEITADIFWDAVMDEQYEGDLIDKILDRTEMNVPENWTVQEVIELSIIAPTITASLEPRVSTAKMFDEYMLEEGFHWVNTSRSIDKNRLIDDVRHALYFSKICNYAQGMNLLRAKSKQMAWNLNLEELARIWKGGCIIRARFLDKIKKAYERNRDLKNLIVDPEFVKEMVQRQAACRRVVGLSIEVGITTSAMSASLAYFNIYKRAN